MNNGLFPSRWGLRYAVFLCGQIGMTNGNAQNEMVNDAKIRLGGTFVSVFGSFSWIQVGRSPPSRTAGVLCEA